VLQILKPPGVEKMHLVICPVSQFVTAGTMRERPESFLHFGLPGKGRANATRLAPNQDTGHWVMEERPKETTDALMSSL